MNVLTWSVALPAGRRLKEHATPATIYATDKKPNIVAMNLAPGTFINSITINIGYADIVQLYY